jgi:hypothetical protein
MMFVFALLASSCFRSAQVMQKELKRFKKKLSYQRALGGYVALPQALNALSSKPRTMALFAATNYSPIN